MLKFLSSWAMGLGSCWGQVKVARVTYLGSTRRSEEGVVSCWGGEVIGDRSQVQERTSRGASDPRAPPQLVKYLGPVHSPSLTPECPVMQSCFQVLALGPSPGGGASLDHGLCFQASGDGGTICASLFPLCLHHPLILPSLTASTA